MYIKVLYVILCNNEFVHLKLFFALRNFYIAFTARAAKMADKLKLVTVIIENMNLFSNLLAEFNFVEFT